MLLYFKLSYLASSISIITLTVGLTFGQPTTQRSLAQTHIKGGGSTFAGERLYLSQGGWFNTYSVAVNSSVQFPYIPQLLPNVPLPNPILPIAVLGGYAFGATDAPATQAEIELYERTLQFLYGQAVQVPVVASAITLAYNPIFLNRGLNGQIGFSRRTYCGILNGEITNWNDPRITEDNGGVAVSDNLPITVVHRSDGSGSTDILSNHLNTACQGLVPSSLNWARGVGKYSANAPAPNPAVADTVYWPSTFISARDASGIVSTVSSTPGAIGYVDNPTRLAAGLSVAILQNRSGSYAGPRADRVAAALENASDLNSSPNIITVTVPDPPQATAYPIVGVSYLLFYGIYTNPNSSAGIKGFINWALAANPPAGETDPNTIATNRGYAPLPANLKIAVTNVVNTYVTP